MIATAACIGWDIGGAHLKAAAIDAEGRVLALAQQPCALWRGLDRLDVAVAAVFDALPATAGAARHAVTMTGELADAFADRASGVGAIAERIARLLAARHQAAPAFFAGDRFAALADLAEEAVQVASANWLATATWIGGWRAQALLLDIGSTTTDIVPISEGVVVAAGADDAGRMAAGELVYTGVVRTPIYALADRVPVDGVLAPMMAELFATSADVYRLTGELDEHYDQHEAADGGPKTIEASARRLARMVGADVASRPPAAWVRLAYALREEQLARIVRACLLVESRCRDRTALAAEAPVVIAGCGAFLGEEVARRLRRPQLSFASLLDAAGSDHGGGQGESADPVAIAQAAPALAVALLALGHTLSA